MTTPPSGVIALTESQGPATGVAAVTAGSLPVSSAEVLRWLEDRAKEHDRAALSWEWPQSFEDNHRASWLRSIANNLRWELERAGVRQPEENIPDEPTRGASDKPNTK